METDGYQLLDQLERFASLTWEQQATWSKQSGYWRNAQPDEVEKLLEVLTQQVLTERQGAWQRAFDAVLPELVRRYATINAQQLRRETVEQMAALYRQLHGLRQTRAHLLRILASDAHPDALEMLAELTATDPPDDARDADLALVPLVQNEGLQADALYPRLLAGVAHPSAAVQVLDVTNHLFRKGLIDSHPGKARLGEWTQLVKAVAAHLEQLQQSGPKETDPARLAKMVGDSTSLLVALCDTLALIGDPQAADALKHVLALRHRRVRTEAAAALCRLGDDEGLDALLEMVEESSMRNRALAYLEELGRLDLVEERFRTEAAKAECDLSCYLASSTQFGAAPLRLDLIDERSMQWPGYDEPVTCYLFGFEYLLPQGELHGIGMSGPFCACLQADLQGLAAEDLYAVYAGWSSQHEQMQEYEPNQVPSQFQPGVTQLNEELAEMGYERVRLLKVGKFFENLVIVAAAEVAGEPGVVVATYDEVCWHPVREDATRLGPNEAYWLYTGRKLLTAFNSDSEDADAADAEDTLA